MTAPAKTKAPFIVLLVVAAVFFIWLAQSVFFNTAKTNPERLSEDEVFLRIRPVAQQNLPAAGGAVATKTYASGEEVYQAVCAACHAAGVIGAPKYGDKAAWGPRIAQGFPTLLKNATAGIRQMPARGGNPQLSDYDLARAITYMTKAAGASFPEPKAPAKK